MQFAGFGVALSFLIAIPSSATEVADVRVGLVCDPGKNGWICIQTEDIHLTGQGKCVFNKQEMPCTWYGFSFQYWDNKPGTQLVCNYKTALPWTMGNPTQVVEGQTTEGTYSLPLEGTNGRFYNPQYRIYGLRDRGQPIDVISTRCSIDGKEVVNFRFNIITGEIPEARRDL